jgi:hypothetical protein
MTGLGRQYRWKTASPGGWTTGANWDRPAHAEELDPNPVDDTVDIEFALPRAFLGGLIGHGAIW